MQAARGQIETEAAERASKRAQDKETRRQERAGKADPEAVEARRPGPSSANGAPEPDGYAPRRRDMRTRLAVVLSVVLLTAGAAVALLPPHIVARVGCTWLGSHGDGPPGTAPSNTWETHCPAPTPPPQTPFIAIACGLLGAVLLIAALLASGRRRLVPTTLASILTAAGVIVAVAPLHVFVHEYTDTTFPGGSVDLCSRQQQAARLAGVNNLRIIIDCPAPHVVRHPALGSLLALAGVLVFAAAFHRFRNARADEMPMAAPTHHPTP